MHRFVSRYLPWLLVFGAIGAHAVAGGPSASATGRSGEEVFQSFCTECHSTGITGAPKIGDKPNWMPRIAQGRAILEQHAIHGYKLMPARGSCSACSDAEIRAAVDFIVSKTK